jgi:hypothetical protein
MKINGWGQFSQAKVRLQSLFSGIALQKTSFKPIKKAQ